MVAPILSLLEKVDDGSDRAAHRIQAYKRLRNINRIVDEAGLFIEGALADEVLVHCDAFLKHYSWLAEVSKTQGLLRYNVVTKMHYVWHICYFARFQNPKVMWCYIFEDFVGRVQKSAKACTSGTTMDRVPRKLFQNYVRALSRTLSNP